MTEELQKYQEELYTDYSSMDEQRDKSNEELRFCMVPGGQWEGFLESDYENRAKLELDEVTDYFFRTYAQWVDNRLLPTYSPADSEGSEEVADTLTGLFRRDIRRNNGTSAIDNGVFEQMGGGIGAIKLSTVYEDEEDEDSEDQVIQFDPVANAYSVVAWDAAASRADKADAKRCTLLIPYSDEEFKARWPDANATDAKTPQNRSYLNWNGDNGKTVYVACRYHIEEERKKVISYGNPLTGEIIKIDDKEDYLVSDLTESGFEKLKERKVKRRVVYKTLFSGGEILEPKRRIAGKYIPIIPFYGYRTFLDGKEFCFGVIRKKMDGQRLLNMSISLAAEASAHGPEDKLIFDPEQMQNPSVRNMWAQNRHQAPYLLAQSLTNEAGDIVQSGPVGTAPGASLSQASQALISIVRDITQRGTGGAAQDTLDPDASGKAINAMLKRTDMNTRPIFDNIVSSVEQIGRVYQAMASEVYSSRIGRQTKVLSEDGNSSMTTLMAPKGKNGLFTYNNDLSKGKFEPVVNVGPGYETQREETIAGLKDALQVISQANPQDPMVKMLASKLIIESNWTGMDDIKDFIRRDLMLQGVVKPETDEDKAFLQQVGMSKGNDSQTKLLEAATKEQETQALKNLKESQETDADILAKQAKARRDNAEAEAQEIDNGLARLGVGVIERRISV